MADLIVNRGLQVIAGRAFNTADSFAVIQSMSVDDSSTAFGATDTALNSGGAVASVASADFDSTPTRSAQTVTWVATIPAGSGNFTIRRIAIHNVATGSVSASSASLIAGTDAQALTKTSDFSLKVTGTLTATDNS